MLVEVTYDMTPKPKIMAIYANKTKSKVIMVLADISYEITQNGFTQKVDMTKWYSHSLQVITHIENDIENGYYPNVRRVA